jgi:hypothetical protein
MGHPGNSGSVTLCNTGKSNAKGKRLVTSASLFPFSQLFGGRRPGVALAHSFSCDAPTSCQKRRQAFAFQRDARNHQSSLPADPACCFRRSAFFFLSDIRVEARRVGVGIVEITPPRRRRERAPSPATADSRGGLLLSHIYAEPLPTLRQALDNMRGLVIVPGNPKELLVPTQ